MSITSVFFLLFVVAGLIVYYLIPRRFQWIWLLILSIFFYYNSDSFISILYLVGASSVAYIATMISLKYKKDSLSKIPFFATVVAVVLIVLTWFIVKGRGLWEIVLIKLNGGTSPIQDIRFIAALGMGYYTLQLTGYVVDCYWESIKPQKNPLKLFLFTAYFPQLITGPISTYNQLESLFEGHRFDYDNIALGAQRVLWGFVKKIVLAGRVGIIVNAITTFTDTYTGFYSWIAILLYPVQMYADFSGCMDIVLGVSEMFGIKLPENFNNPFFARTSQEFWQRWHITLGVWAKNYVLYPILKSPLLLKLNKYLQKHFSKKTGKLIVTSVGMFFLWMVIGVWHGGLRYIVGVSLWYWIILMLGDICSPMFSKINGKLGFKTDSFSWHFFQSARTYLIYATGAMFFCLGVERGLFVITNALKTLFIKEYCNPWVLFDGSITTIVSLPDINVIIIAVIMMIIVGVLREKYGYARTWIKSQGFIFRWGIWLGLLLFVVVWGMYGPGYDASEFIYKGF